MSEDTSKLRVLFVDDDPDLLLGLRRMLRPERHAWDMTFASSGQHALELLSAHPADVVVSDMRMPGMDGAELLGRVRDQYPETVRIILSGQSQNESVLRCVGPVHQYLSKPCQPDLLKQAIRRTTWLHSRLNAPELRRVVGRVDHLPVLPHLYNRLVHELNSPHASLDRVARLITSDLSMTTRILKLINSSFFGMRQPVTDIRRAVTLLGLETIQRLVLVAGVFQDLDHPVPGFDLAALTSHSMATGLCAQAIAAAELSEPSAPGEAMTAGVLHDIGRFVLAVAVGDQYATTLSTMRTEGIDLLEAEQRTLGVQHPEVGAYLLGLWGLPHSIVEAAALHHAPFAEDTQQVDLTLIIAGANLLAREHALLQSHHADTAVPSRRAILQETTDAARQLSPSLSNRLPQWRELARKALSQTAASNAAAL